MENIDVYKDIQARTNGEIYMGIVGPVRTGKSTFIKRFMDLWVIPNIEDVHSKQRTIDELPQSGNGKTIMTTEPKFVPKEAAQINISDNISLKVRLIDCVGYMVNGAAGHIENEQDRMVKTPWFDYEVPFVKAAEIGTGKVITEHSTIGIVITSDGSFGELDRESYIAPEQKTIQELKQLKKPFVVILNSDRPFSAETRNMALQMEEEYNVKVLPLNCEQLRKQDIVKIFEEILAVFPVTEIVYQTPKWLDILSLDNPVKRKVVECAGKILESINLVNDVEKINCNDILKQDEEEECYISKIKIDNINMQTGSVSIAICVDDKYYFDTLSKLTGVEISNEYQLINIIKELADKRNEYLKVENACNEVKNSGYGVVSADINDIIIEKPEIIKHGGKYGVKIKATAPSTHMLLANISVEIAPIVGNEQQAMDLIKYIEENSMDNQEGIWETNIFGKSIRQLIDEGIHTKVNKMTGETREKMRETLQKIINESSGGVICIIF